MTRFSFRRSSWDDYASALFRRFFGCDLIVVVGGEPVETMESYSACSVGERIGAAVTFMVARHERVLDIVVVPHELAA